MQAFFFSLLLLWFLVLAGYIFTHFSLPLSSGKRAFPATVLSDSLVFVMHNILSWHVASYSPLSSKAEIYDKFQALQVSSSSKAETPLTLISVSLLFCFLVVSFAVCHAVALPWFMSCLCFVSVSIPVHLKCPARPPSVSLPQSILQISLFSPSLQL